MPRRSYLFPISIAAHAVVGVTLLVSSRWQLERLESDHRLAGIGVMTPSMGGGGGEPDLPTPKLVKKAQPKRIVKDLVQHTTPTDERDDASAASRSTGTGTGDGQGSGAGPGSGSGDGPGDQACVGLSCGPGDPIPDPPKPPEPPPAPKIVAAHVMTALRTSGNTQVFAPRTVQRQMLDAGVRRTVGTVKVCISTTGAISHASIVGSTKYDDYDQLLVAAVRTWRYRPHTVNGIPTPVCSAVSFVYEIQ